MIHRFPPFVRSSLAKTLLALVGVSLLSATQLSAQDLIEPKPTGKETAQKNPYRLVGLLRFFFGKREAIGSGTVVRARGVLSCAHNMFDPKEGFSFEIIFERGRYKGQLSRTVRPKRVVVLSGYENKATAKGVASQAAFSRDISVLRFKGLLAGGDRLRVRSRLDLLKKEGVTKTAFGYGAATHDGETLLESGSDSAWKIIRPGYFKSTANLLEGGMSGGPVILGLDKVPFQAAVNVSGSSILSGYRVVTPEVLRLISENL